MCRNGRNAAAFDQHVRSLGCRLVATDDATAADKEDATIVQSGSGRARRHAASVACPGPRTDPLHGRTATTTERSCHLRVVTGQELPATRLGLDLPVPPDDLPA